VRTEERIAAAATATLLFREAERIRAQLPGERGHGSRGQSQRGQCHRVVLDRRGIDITTAGLAQRLAAWQQQARPVAIVIGGPDGFDPALAAEADETLRLSSLTLPHTLARVIVAEQLYRAWSVLANHPYHRA
jgi:23S rRNA (pseudouridine1915-N3)-methyltransferase